MISFDPFDKDKWLIDHCPTYIIPSFPLMGVVAVLLLSAKQQFPTQKMIHINELQLFKFIPANKKFSLSTQFNSFNQNEYKVQIFLWCEEKQTLVGSAVISLTEDIEVPLTINVPQVSGNFIDHYHKGLFHQRLFQWTESVLLGQDESLSTIRINADNSIILLDNMLHGIPHDNLHLWCSSIPKDLLALPVQIYHMKLYQELPKTGVVLVHAKFLGFYKELKSFPCFTVSAFVDDHLLLTFELIETLLPKTKIGFDIHFREEFIRFRHYVPNYGLSEYDGHSTYLSVAQVKQANWLNGMMSGLYDSQGDLRQLARKIAIQEHIAHQLMVHPSEIEVLGWQIARWRLEPAFIYWVDMIEEELGFKVTGTICSANS